jgi:hypothetical protein
MPFGLKNDGATFQRAMSFAFHDLKHIVEAYLDDLGGYRGPPTFSKWLKTVFWPFWQFTIFSRFSLPGPF